MAAALFSKQRVGAIGRQVRLGLGLKLFAIAQLALWMKALSSASKYAGSFPPSRIEGCDVLIRIFWRSAGYNHTRIRRQYYGETVMVKGTSQRL